MTVEPLATLNVRFRSSGSSNIGEGCQLQRHTTTAVSTTATANETMIRGLDQPHCCPWVTASTSAAIATANSSAPRMSGIRLRPGVRLSTSLRRASMTTAIPTGMFTRNTSRQSAIAIRTPPIDGPRPEKAAPTAPSSATPCERWFGGNAFSTIASAAVTRHAAPSAWIARKTISSAGDGAIAHSSDAKVNSSTPKMKMRLRPIRSASFPTGTRNAANTML